jgi:hypothetical protein
MILNAKSRVLLLEITDKLFFLRDNAPRLTTMYNTRGTEKMNKPQRIGLTLEQSINSFSDDELYMLSFGNTKQANSYRELLAFRKQDVQKKNTAGQNPTLQSV